MVLLTGLFKSYFNILSWANMYSLTVAESSFSSIYFNSKQVQSQMETTWKQMCCREKEFTSAATGLETELNNVRRQLQSLEGEKEDVLRDKENLLEEVSSSPYLQIFLTVLLYSCAYQFLFPLSFWSFFIINNLMPHYLR